MTEEDLYTLALMHTNGIGQISALRLYQQMDNAKAIYDNRKNLKELLPEANDCLIQKLLQMDNYLGQAETELNYMQQHNIAVTSFNSPNYPVRLRQIKDAPLLLFSRGKANLNAHHIVSVVGTRHITEYGKKVCADFCKQLSNALPQTLVVSGLAYGVDVHTHRAALANHLPTVGVLAHGLDTLYPAVHREIANEMIENQGGLLTEYSINTRIGKENFIRRNRIVAAMSDTTLVVESAAKGGALVTARLADEYGRQVFACPGRLIDPYSEGCNRLLEKNKAYVFTDIDSMIAELNWQPLTKPLEVQRELFPQLSTEETLVCDALKVPDGLTLVQLSKKISKPLPELNGLLFQLEVKGVTKQLTNGNYSLVEF